MINERAVAYSEVYAILKMMDPLYLDKIPNRLQQIIIEEMDKDYQPKIVSNTILAMLNLNYWCQSQEHKEELLKIYSNNERIKDEKIRELYNPDNIFKNKIHNTANNTNETMALVEYKESVFKRLINKIKELFKR